MKANTTLQMIIIMIILIASVDSVSAVLLSGNYEDYTFEANGEYIINGHVTIGGEYFIVEEGVSVYFVGNNVLTVVATNVWINDPDDGNGGNPANPPTFYDYYDIAFSCVDNLLVLWTYIHMNA